MSSYVYKHIVPNKKAYIGVTGQKKPELRWGIEGNHYKNNIEFMKDIKLYGWNNIKHLILYSDLSKEDAERIEIILISKFRTYDSRFGYNRTFGGNISKGNILESTRNKMRQNYKNQCSQGKHPRLGKKMSEVQKQYYHELFSSESNPLRGKKRPQHVIDALREANTGKVPTEESRRKNSESHSGEKNSNYGKHHSEITRRKISNKEKGKVVSSLTKEKLIESHEKTMISQFDLDGHFKQKFNGINVASRSTGIDRANIAKVCNGGYKKAGGYRWKYYSDGDGELILEPITNHSLSPVMQYDKKRNLIGEFSNIAEASKLTGINPSSISQVCRGKRKFAGDCIWQYSKRI